MRSHSSTFSASSQRYSAAPAVAGVRALPGDGASDQIRSSRGSDTGRSAHAADAVRETPTEVVCGKKIK
jgi:hypothetical protein